MKPETKVAVVTGGARRIGRALACGLADAGWAVALHYRTSEREALDALRAIEERGGRCALFSGDLTEVGAAERLIDESATLGSVRCLVNSASIFEKDEFANFTREAMLRHIIVNAITPMELARAAALRCPDGGVVIDILDQKIANPDDYFFSYTVSKLALAAAGTVLARVLAPKWRHVGIAPGLTLPSGSQSEDTFALVHDKTLLERGTQVQDVVAAALYVVNAPALVGQILFVDGGERLVPPSERGF